MYPIMLHVVSPSFKFRSVSLYDQTFSSYRPLWSKCIEWTQNDLVHYKMKGTPYMCYQYYRVPNFSPFCSTTSPFQDLVHFIIPHWLQAKKHNKKCQQFKISTIHKSEISIRFALPQPFLRYRPFWDKCTDDPKITLNHTRSNVSHKTSVPEFQVSLSFAPWSAVFELLVILRQVHRMIPNEIEHYKVKDTPYMCY